MRYLWNTDRQSKILHVEVFSPQPQQVMISVYDWKKPDTVYYRHVAEINGHDLFEISLPITPQKAFFEITPINQANMPFDGFDPRIKVAFTQQNFTPGMNCNFNSDKNLQDFLRFIAWFGENAGVLSASNGSDDFSIYRSVNGKFQIKYSKRIMEEPYTRNQDGEIVENPRYGLESPTSYRVEDEEKNKKQGTWDGVTKIEVSQNRAKKYTVTGRIVLGLHEGAHDFINVDPDDEAEADRNAIIIARCLGFGKREIADALTDVYLRWPSDENKYRTDEMMALLKELN